MLCFTASYAVALALEVLGLWTRPRWRRLAVVLAAVAGIVAHTWYLGQRAGAVGVGAAFQPARLVSCRRVGAGRALCGAAALPAESVDGRVSAAGHARPDRGCARAPRDAIASFEAPRTWGMIHGVFLMLGTVAVLMGFVAGVMYLLQSYRLKQKLPADANFRLPSLEWLERVNTPVAGRGGRAGGPGILYRHRRPVGDGRRRDPLDRPGGAQPQRHAVVAGRRGSVSAGVPGGPPGPQGGVPDARRIRLSGVHAGDVYASGRGAWGEGRGTRSEERESRWSRLAPRSSLLAPRRRFPMNLRMVGCTHRAAGVDVRQQLAFGEHQVGDALARWRGRFPGGRAGAAVDVQPRRAVRRRRRGGERAGERRTGRRAAQLSQRSRRAAWRGR